MVSGSSWLFPLVGCAALLLAPLRQAKVEQEAASYATQSLRGKVVFLADAMKRRFGVETDPDARQTIVALETANGELHPIVKDPRGRGFLIDPRIRDREMELLVRRYHGSPMVQVIRICTIKDGKRYEFDYWCDVCAIPMFELKDCECCQGPIRIRERLLEDDTKPQ